MFAWLYWNPKREVFTIPILDIPVLWYGLLFALGFFCGYYIFRQLVIRYFLLYPEINRSDIKDEERFVSIFSNKKDNKKNGFLSFFFSIKENFKKNESKLLFYIRKFNLLALQEEKTKSFFNENGDKKTKKILSSKAFLNPVASASRVFIDNSFHFVIQTIKEKATHITDRITIYMFVATIIGARLGHLLFYESPSYYFYQPWVIFQVWKGGLASHGAAISIIIAMFIFVYRLDKSFYPKLDVIRLLDFICLPTAFAAIFIRIGNFFNQEILGSPSQVPWAVIFCRPMDNVSIVPRHPAQLYEALFYLFVFIVLFYLSHRTLLILKKGKMIGIFLFLIFGFRFVIEFFKIEQSNLLDSSYFLMGQYLSIPLILLGIVFYFWTNIFYYKPTQAFSLENLIK